MTEDGMVGWYRTRGKSFGVGLDGGGGTSHLPKLFGQEGGGGEEREPVDKSHTMKGVFHLQARR